ncbi:UNVERIFIED_CONTAM: hypothetical protein LK11_25805 [Mumia flava]
MVKPIPAVTLLDTEVDTQPLEGSRRQVQASGIGGIPARGVDAVTVLITVRSATTDGDGIVVGPQDDQITVSQYGVGRLPAPQSVTVPLDADGRFQVGNSIGSTHARIDALAFHASEGTAEIDRGRIVLLQNPVAFPGMALEANASGELIVTRRFGIPAGTLAVLGRVSVDSAGDGVVYFGRGGDAAPRTPTEPGAIAYRASSSSEASSSIMRLNSSGHLAIDLVGSEQARVVVTVTGYVSGDGTGAGILTSTPQTRSICVDVGDRETRSLSLRESLGVNEIGGAEIAVWASDATGDATGWVDVYPTGAPPIGERGVVALGLHEDPLSGVSAVTWIPIAASGDEVTIRNRSGSDQISVCLRPTIVLGRSVSEPRPLAAEDAKPLALPTPDPGSVPQWWNTGRSTMDSPKLVHRSVVDDAYVEGYLWWAYLGTGTADADAKEALLLGVADRVRFFRSGAYCPVAGSNRRLSVALELWSGEPPDSPDLAGWERASADVTSDGVDVEVRTSLDHCLLTSHPAPEPGAYRLEVIHRVVPEEEGSFFTQAHALVRYWPVDAPES